MSKTRQNKGFTLIELLVVIAIIAILAAILFPVFAQARESARTIACVSNEKQISLGMLMYVQDYDERFPQWQYGIPMLPRDPSGGLYSDEHTGWDEACQPYIKSKQVLWCPSVDSPGNDYNNPQKGDSCWTGSLNYATNCRLVGKYTNNVPAKLSTMSYPAQSILLSENGPEGSEGACRIENDEWGWTGTGTDALAFQTYNNTLVPGPLTRHKGGSNYAFGDGHVKWMNSQNLGLKYINGVYSANVVDVQRIMNDSGNVPTYHIAVGN